MDATFQVNDSSSTLAESFPRPREFAFIFTVCLAQMLQLAGLAQSIAPLHIIGNSFDVHDAGRLSWTAAAYSLTVGTFILPAGRLGDIIGHKKLFLIGAAVFGLWNILAGVSVYSNFEFYVVCRAFEGLGASLMVPAALALIGRVYAHGDRKNMVFALFGAAAPVGWIFGALISALFAQLAWWPWIYYSAGLVSFALVFFAAFTIPADNPPPSTTTTEEETENGTTEQPRKLSSSHRQFDYLGCITGVSGLVLFNFAWNQAFVVGWQTPYTYFLLIISILLLPIFVYIELFIARDPLIPFRNLSKQTALVLLILGAGWGSFGIWIFYIWQLLSVLRGLSPLAIVAQNSPVAVSGLLASVLTGFLLSKLRVSTILTIALLCFLVGQVLIATVPVSQTYWAQTFISFILMPVGLDMSFPTGSAILSSSMARGDQGLASSLVLTVVNYSVSLCLGFAGTLEMNVNNGGADLMTGFRGAWWFGVGLDVLGLVACGYFVWVSR